MKFFSFVTTHHHQQNPQTTNHSPVNGQNPSVSKNPPQSVSKLELKEYTKDDHPNPLLLLRKGRRRPLGTVHEAPGRRHDRRRRHGPARLQALLLQEDDNDARRPDRKAAEVQPLRTRPP